jgi:ribosomal protein S6
MIGFIHNQKSPKAPRSAPAQIRRYIPPQERTFLVDFNFYHAKNHMEYELLFFTSVANADRAGEIKREIEEILSGRGAKKTADWNDIGKRKFAHPIKKQTHGFFSFCRFTIEDAENLPELNKRLSLNDKVMRHIIVRADEIGKPIGAPTMPDAKQETRGRRVPEVSAAKKVSAQIVPPAKSEAEEKMSPEEIAKVEMKELDEKLDAILDESPE